MTPKRRLFDIIISPLEWRHRRRSSSPCSCPAFRISVNSAANPRARVEGAAGCPATTSARAGCTLRELYRNWSSTQCFEKEFDCVFLLLPAKMFALFVVRCPCPCFLFSFAFSTCGILHVRMCNCRLILGRNFTTTPSTTTLSPALPLASPPTPSSTPTLSPPATSATAPIKRPGSLMVAHCVV